MNSFLRDARKWLKLKESMVIVVGNESCDLDSAVCAIGFAYFYSKSDKCPEWLYTNGERRFLPVMNISRQNLPLKSEVMYFMNENQIDVANLVCRYLIFYLHFQHFFTYLLLFLNSDEVRNDFLSMSRFVLVDHHISTFSIPNERIIQIIDHRPIDVNNKKFPHECKTRIVEVGSCATLVAEDIFNMIQPHEKFNDLLAFLRGPIVMDTVNFSVAAGKTKQLDIEINQRIEELLNVSEDDRSQLFNALTAANTDVSSLNAFQILSKDLKTVSNQNKSIFVAIPGFPLLVEVI